MRRDRWILIALLVVAIVGAGPSMQGRPWKEAAGERTIEAEFVSLTDGKVRLKRPDGKIVVVPLEKFSAADQKIAEELAGAATSPQIEVVGIGISKPSGPGGGLISHGMQVNGGVTLTLLVPAGDRTFVNFDKEASRIDSCTDDQGNSLVAPPDDLNVKQFGSFDSHLDRDGKRCFVSVSLPGIPAKGTQKIQFKATLVIHAGSQDKSEEQKDVPLKSGSEITVGPVPMRINSVQERMITLHSDQPRDAIKWIDFFDSDGNVVEYDELGSNSTGFKGEQSYSITYALHEKLDKVTVRITYLTDVETLTLPVNVEAGLGL